MRTSTGKREPPFKTAGGHFNPGKKDHGALVPTGAHAGDLPNVSRRRRRHPEVRAARPRAHPGGRPEQRLRRRRVLRRPARQGGRLPEPAGGRLGRPDRPAASPPGPEGSPRTTNSCKCPEPWLIHGSPAPLNGLSVLPNRVTPMDRDGRPGPPIEQQSLLAEWTWFAPAPRPARPSTSMPAGRCFAAALAPGRRATAGGRALLPATCPPGRNAPAVTGSVHPPRLRGAIGPWRDASLSPGAGAAGVQVAAAPAAPGELARSPSSSS